MKKLTLLITITLLLTTISIQTTANNNINTKTIAVIIVDDEGDGNYQNITTAIQHANNGDIIKIYSGTYNENIILDKKIQLKGYPYEYKNGNDTGKPVINGQQKGDIIKIKADNCRITNLKIINGGTHNPNGVGINIYGTDNHIIYNNTIKGNEVGIALVADNTKHLLPFRKNYPSNCVIAYNQIEYNIFGIHLLNPKKHEIINNNLTNSGFTIVGTPEQILTNTFENNTVNNKPVYLYINQNQGVINHQNVGQILMYNCQNMILENMTITNTTIGFMIQNSNNLIFRNNTFKDIHRGGISLHADNAEVYNNSFNNNSYSCYVEGGKNIYIHHNNFIKCYKHDQPTDNYIQKHQKFMNTKKLKYDSNYYDDWIGLQKPEYQKLPKIIFGYRKTLHKYLNIFPTIKLDWHPAEKPYDL